MNVFEAIDMRERMKLRIDMLENILLNYDLDAVGLEGERIFIAKQQRIYEGRLADIDLTLGQTEVYVVRGEG